jgi:hypothetical protein
MMSRFRVPVVTGVAALGCRWDWPSYLGVGRARSAGDGRDREGLGPSALAGVASMGPCEHDAAIATACSHAQNTSRVYGANVLQPVMVRSQPPSLLRTALSCGSQIRHTASVTAYIFSVGDKRTVACS